MSALEKRLPLPDVSPSWYHALALGLSVVYLYVHSPWLKIVLIVVILLADWLDGATARRYSKGSRAGYVLDVVTDRASEALIFSAESSAAIGQVFFVLWLLNLVLAFYSVRTNKHTSLALRSAYLVVLFMPMLGLGPR